MYFQLINAMSTAKTRSSCKQNAQWYVNFQHEQAQAGTDLDLSHKPTIPHSTNF